MWLLPFLWLLWECRIITGLNDQAIYPMFYDVVCPVFVVAMQQNKTVRQVKENLKDFKARANESDVSRPQICICVIYINILWALWLSDFKTIDFKIAVLVWKCIHGRAPAYLSDLCRPLAGIPGRRQLRSSSSSDLLVPRSRTATGQRAFAIYGPALWNRLPASLRSPELSLFTFWRNLKTYLMGRR